MYVIKDKGMQCFAALFGKQVIVNCFLGKREHEDVPVTGIGIAINYADGESRMNFRSLTGLSSGDFAKARRVLEIFVPAIIRAKNLGRSIEKRAIWSSLILVSFHQKRIRLPNLGRVQRYMLGIEIDHLQGVLDALGISTAKIEDVIRSGRAYSMADTSHSAMTVPKQIRGTTPLTMSPEHPFW